MAGTHKGGIHGGHTCAARKCYDSRQSMQYTQHGKTARQYSSTRHVAEQASKQHRLRTQHQETLAVASSSGSNTSSAGDTRQHQVALGSTRRQHQHIRRLSHRPASLFAASSSGSSSTSGSSTSTALAAAAQEPLILEALAVPLKQPASSFRSVCSAVAAATVNAGTPGGSSINSTS